MNESGSDSGATSESEPQPVASREMKPPPLRQCDRCHLFFPPAADLHPSELTQGWLCDNCSASLTPGHTGPPSTETPASDDSR